MSVSISELILLNALVADSANEQIYSSNGKSIALATISFNEAPTAGSADVVFEIIDVAGVWHEIHREELDGTTLTGNPAPILFDPLLSKQFRARIENYTGLAGAGGALEVTVCAAFSN